MKKKRKNAFIDCDDILYVCNGERIRRLNAEKGYHYTINDLTGWGPLGNPTDEGLVYFGDPEFIRNLPLYDGAKEFVQELKKHVNVFFATSVHPRCAGARIDSLVENFGVDPADIIIGSRKDMLKADIILDDNPANLKSESIPYRVLFRRPWNHDQSGLPAVSNYKEFLTFVNRIQTIESTVEPDDSVVVLIGPTGAGKNRVLQEYVARGYEAVRSYSTKKDLKYNVIPKAEFLRLKEDGFFSETSVYAGELFGIRYEDVMDIRKRGKKAVIIADINGAIALETICSAKIVFVKASKEECIRDILLRDISLEEKVHRIGSLDVEFQNEEFCDETVIGRRE